MPKPSKSARLWLRPPRVKDGAHCSSVWLILDGGRQFSTGCGPEQHAEAEQKLAAYISQKHEPDRSGSRSPGTVPIADVLTIYLQDKLENVENPIARPKELASRVRFLQSFWGLKTLADVNGKACRDYAKFRGKLQAARRELEDLRAAIKYHRKEGLCSEIVEVVLPEKSLPRERWLTRAEAARLILTAWRKKAAQRHRPGELPVMRPVGRHIARFILVGLYTGTRAGAICGASLTHVSGRGYVDLGRGIFYRRAAGARETKKRQPPVPIPDRLLAHIRRWSRLGLCHNAIVEWNGKPVGRVTKAFDRAVAAAGLGDDVTPHTLRHTAATWMKEAGAETSDVAKYLGMTEKMVEERYGHIGPMAHARARAAIGHRPGSKNQCGSPNGSQRYNPKTPEQSGTNKNEKH